MKILVVGAGAVGGYFGGRLFEKGEDVTFLVREKRKIQLKEYGLKINSVHGNATLYPKLILAGEDEGTFDVIIISTKAYHLEKVLEEINQYVGQNTIIIPLLNGIAHLELLRNKFGQNRIIGGLCFIESTLDQNGTIVQTSSNHDMVYGEFTGEKTERMQLLEKVFSNTNANFRLSNQINTEMWQKYLFITTLSGITTLTRSSLGPIREVSLGKDFIHRFGKEIISIMESIQAPLSQNIEEILMSRIESLHTSLKASMLRDMEKGLSIEADHLQGYLYNIAKREGIDVPILSTIYANLKIYEKINLAKNVTS